MLQASPADIFIHKYIHTDINTHTYVFAYLHTCTYTSTEKYFCYNRYNSNTSKNFAFVHLLNFLQISMLLYSLIHEEKFQSTGYICVHMGVHEHPPNKHTYVCIRNKQNKTKTSQKLTSLRQLIWDVLKKITELINYFGVLSVPCSSMLLHSVFWLLDSGLIHGVYSQCTAHTPRHPDSHT